MKRLITFLAVALVAVSFVGCHEHPLFAQERVESAKVGGKWQMTMETPHGAVTGPLEVQQTGSKLSGTYAVEHMGTLSFTGTVDGKKVTFSMEVPGGDQKFGFTGTVEGEKMSGTTEMGGTWKASR